VSTLLKVILSGATLCSFLWALPAIAEPESEEVLLSTCFRNNGEEGFCLATITNEVKPFPEPLPPEQQPDNIWAPAVHWKPLNQGRWLLVWNEPAGDGLQLATTRDLATWTHNPNATFPRAADHGSLFLAPRGRVGWLVESAPSK